MNTAAKAWTFLRTRLSVTAAALMIVLLSGCTSVPLATIWQLRNFEPDDLQQVRPEEILLAGKVDPAPITFNPSGSRLLIVLTPRAEGTADVQYEFGSRNARLDEPQLVPDGDPRWQVFELDDEGVAAWERLQPELTDVKTKYKALAFNSSLRTEGHAPPGTDALIYSVRLQLRPSQKPPTIMDRARIPLDKF